jgi:hypothetical protein
MRAPLLQEMNTLGMPEKRGHHRVVLNGCCIVADWGVLIKKVDRSVIPLSLAYTDALKKKSSSCTPKDPDCTVTSLAIMITWSRM